MVASTVFKELKVGITMETLWLVSMDFFITFDESGNVIHRANFRYLFGTQAFPIDVFELFDDIALKSVTNDLCRDSTHDSIFRNILIYKSPGPHNSSTPNVYSIEYH